MGALLNQSKRLLLRHTYVSSLQINKLVELCVWCSELSEHMVTTGDVGLPASALRSRYPQVTFHSIVSLPVVNFACVLRCGPDVLSFIA